MRLISETLEEKQSILIVDAKSTNLGKLLKQALKKYGSEVFISPQLPARHTQFHHIFLINERGYVNYIKKVAPSATFIYLGDKGLADTVASHITKQDAQNVKVVFVTTDLPTEADVEKILWFAFSKSKERFLPIRTVSATIKKEEKLWLIEFFEPLFNFIRGNFLLTLALFILAYHIVMGLTLGLSSLALYNSAQALLHQDTAKSKRLLSLSAPSFTIAKGLYSPMRGVYLFFSRSLFPDTLFEINEKTASALSISLETQDNAQQLMSLIFKKEKSDGEKQTLLTRLVKLQQELDQLEDQLISIAQRLPDSPNRIKKLKGNLSDAIEFVQKGKRILPHLPDLLAKGGEKKYLVLFANNMELRPGGGFIGSFGIARFKDLTFEDMQVYDVYDADGQLSLHIDPPDPLRKYLNQPNWFLRDSAFSSDFFENYNQAKFFLREELGLTDFSGGILITTTAIQEILESFGNIYLSDFNETVNKDNFYIKAQVYAEKDFFPGSIQKKSFLGSLTRYILLNLDSVSPSAFLKQTKRAFDEKQAVAIFDNPKLQSVVDSFYWAGKTITPVCSTANPNCVLDYIFPVDANLGINKANFFVSRTMKQTITVKSDGTIKHSFALTFKNDSARDVFPGGTYKNYFQLFIPKNARISQLTKNGSLIVDYDQRQTEFTVVGFFLEIPPQKTTEIVIDYDLEEHLDSGHGIYQLVFQKQTGSKNSDLNLEFILEPGVSLVDQNFAPVVKGSHVDYNTNLGADKIFLLEFLRQ